MSRAWVAAWSSTRLSTWAPRRRTHLLWAACASVLTVLLESETPAWSGRFEVAGGLALALASARPVVGGALSLLVTCVFHVVARGDVVAILPLIGPWLCASVLLTRGYSRLAAYGLMLASATAQLASFLLFPSEYGLSSIDLFTIFVEGACLVVAELIRRPRVAAEAAAERYQADLERQRLLVVSELHDTVVRDLTRAVMVAEQARLAQPPDAPLADELAGMAGSVQAAVERLRASLRVAGDVAGAAGGTGGARASAAGGAGGTGGAGAGAAGGVGLSVLTPSAPRPLPEVVAQARAVLAGRGTVLETEGLEALEADLVPPGVHQQLVRVLGELVTNMAKYASPGGPARLVIECDGSSLEAMASNAVDAGGAPSDGVASSGLGLTGVQRRVESLGGSLHLAPTSDRWTAVLSVPLQPQ